MFRLLLLGTLTMLFMDEGDRVLTTKLIRFCNKCNYFDGYKWQHKMKSCWKFNVLLYKRSCTTDDFYFSDLVTGRHVCRYSQLSCRPCEEGPSQLFYDLLRETYCCNDKNFCNKAKTDVDV